jgi:hypothetical protein
VSSHEHPPSAFQNFNDLRLAALAYAEVQNVCVRSGVNDRPSALVGVVHGARAGDIRQGTTALVDLPVAAKAALLIGDEFVLEDVGLAGNRQQFHALRAGSIVLPLNMVDQSGVGCALHAGGTSTITGLSGFVRLGMAGDVVVKEGRLDCPCSGPWSHQNRSGRDANTMSYGKRDLAYVVTINGHQLL